MDYKTFETETARVEALSSADQKAFFDRILREEKDHSDVRLMAYFHAALLFYHEGDFRKVKEVLEPFIIDYQSYAYRPELISCFNLMGVASLCKGEHLLARYFFEKGIQIAREHDEKSRYSFEYNNLSLTYIAEQNFEEALHFILLAKKYLSACDDDMGAYIYVNLATIYHNCGQLELAQQAFHTCIHSYRGFEVLPDDAAICGAALFYKLGDHSTYETHKAYILSRLDAMYASEFMDACQVLFDCGLDARDDALVLQVIQTMKSFMQEHPQENKIGLHMEEFKYQYAKARGDSAAMLDALEQKDRRHTAIMLDSEMHHIKELDQYFAINHQLQEAMASKDRANRVKTQFLANMSHDIRTPINGIMGMLEMIRSRREDEAVVNSCLDKIDVSSRHLLSLVNDILDMTKLESSTIILEHKPFNLDKVCSDLDKVLSFQVERAGLHLQQEHGDVRDVNLIGSEVHLKKILSNLFVNCIKYNKPHGSIYTRLRELERTETTVTYEFRIRDTGIGMSESFIRDQLFEPFVQGREASRSAYEGTGLGMSIVAQLVKQMHGTIQVESTPGVGSCFTVVLPFELDPTPPVAVPEEAPLADLHGKTLLVVEDNPLNLEIAEFLLTDSGATVHRAENGQQALECYLNAAAGTYDAILMDLMMPVMDGYEAAQRIRACDKADARTIPIIATSANAFREDVQKCLDAGMNAHVSKPLFRDSLLRVLSQFFTF